MGLLVKRAMRLRAHFGLQRLRLDLAIALEGDAINQIAFGNADDHVVAVTSGGNVQNRPLDQSLQSGLDFGLAGAREMGPDHFSVAMSVSHDLDARGAPARQIRRKRQGSRLRKWDASKKLWSTACNPDPRRNFRRPWARRGSPNNASHTRPSSDPYFPSTRFNECCKC